MSNIINHEQWGKMNDYLHSIAVSLGSTVDVSTWEGVQKAVRMGLAPDLFPIGSQLSVNHSVYGTMMYDVVAHDYFKSAKDENAHTMTLMSHDTLPYIQFDSPEAFYYAENELPAGTYNFTIGSSHASWEKGTYQFTLTKALPKGGQLRIMGDFYTVITELKVGAYASRTTTTITEECGIIVGSGGTPLGTFGKELNEIRRVSYGSNNYKESAVRQFLNSNDGAGDVWVPLTKFTRPPSWVTTLAGFMGGLDSDFLDIVGKVIVPCSANTSYESPDSTTTKGAKYTVADKFYLPSHTEMFGTTIGVYDGSVLFPYYEGATNADRIKYKAGAIARYRTRTADLDSASHTRAVNTDGGPMRYFASNGDVYIAPVCTIV